MTFNALKFPNCEVLLDPSDATFVTKDGSNNTSAMEDLAGNSHDASQGSTPDQPTWLSSGINSLGALDYDGTSEHMDIATLTSILAISASFTISLVFKLDTDDATSKTLLASTVGASDLFIIQRTSSQGISCATYNGATWDNKSVAFTDTTSSHILTVTNSVTNGLKAYIDGIELTSTANTPSSGVTVATTIGCRTTGDLFWDGLIGEIIVYSREMESPEREELEFDLSQKWGTYVPRKIYSESQDLSGHRLVKLYEIDATNQGGTIVRFCSSVDATNEISSITFATTTATATTSTPHTLSASDSVNISGIIQSDYNGDFTVVSVPSSTTFTYTMLGTPTEIAQGGNMLLTRLNNKMVFGGNDYTPIAFEAEGFEYSGQGSLPTPKIRVSNVGKVLAAAVISLNDLVGAKFTRIRTFRKHLDDGSDPDVAAIFPREIYNINRKSSHNKIAIEFELASAIDQEGVKIPGRQCIKRICTHKYRVWTGASFDYSEATCPYIGTSYYDKTDLGTTAENDQCAKQLDSCKLRFLNAPLPTRAFPGVGGTS